MMPGPFLLCVCEAHRAIRRDMESYDLHVGQVLLSSKAALEGEPKQFLRQGEAENYARAWGLGSRGKGRKGSIPAVSYHVG